MSTGVEAIESPSCVAYRHYVMAASEATSFPMSIGATATAIKAVLCEGDDSIAYKLKQRGSILINALDPSQEPSDVIKRAYDVRSIYFHGNTERSKRTKVKQTDELGQLRTAFLHIARQTVLAMLFLEKQGLVQGKKAGLKIIDAAAITTTARRSLEDQLSELREMMRPSS